MAHEFDLTASQKRIARIDSTIRAQKLFIVAVALDQKAEAELNLGTLESMRIKLGVAKEVLEPRGRDGHPRESRRGAGAESTRVDVVVADEA